MEQRKNQRYTYADYLTWNDDNRYELIDGMVHMMASPSAEHQIISVEISRQLSNFLLDKTCRVFVAPFDVRLNADTKDDIVVQPDVFVVCDPEKYKNGKSCKGAPDMIIEIVSPSSMGYDQVTKYNKYLMAGVKEYWIVYPQERSVIVYLLMNEGYFTQSYTETNTVPVATLEGCTIDLKRVFPPLPAEAQDT